MAERSISVQFPLGGVNRRLAYQSQPPYTTPYCLNMRAPDGNLRLRGGRRWGAYKLFAATVGISNPVRLLASVRPISGAVPIVVAASTGEIYYETGGNLSLASGNKTIAGSTESRTAERTGLLYIAKWHATTSNIVPLVFNSADGSVANWVATYGTVPTSCRHICRYRDRMVLVRGNVWYMSRQGDPDDWDFFDDPDDPGRAIASTAANAGAIGAPITAMMPYSDDFLVFACHDSLWMLNGDPGYGGIMQPLSYSTGCISGDAWCHGPSGEIYIMSDSGLWMLPPGGGKPQPVSHEALPYELKSLDISSKYVSMVYNNYEQGLQIYIMPTVSGAATHWFYSIPHQSFWMDTYMAAMGPRLAIEAPRGTPESTTVILGGRDGYVYYLVKGAYQDSATNFISEVLLGPFRAADGLHTGMMKRLLLQLSSNSDVVTWHVYAGSNPETAYNAFLASNHSASGVVAAGNFGTHPCRVAGNAFFVRLGLSGGTLNWSLEDLELVLEQTGLLRP